APLSELTAAAGRLRDEGHGTRMTFSPKVFIPLTMLCRDRCGYCTFAKAPARLDSSFLELDEVLAIARAGREAGCHEALFTLGEAPEERYPRARQWLSERGYASTVEYLGAAAKAVVEETGLLPHANAGALSAADLVSLRSNCPSQGMMLETLAERLGEPGGPHNRAPDKSPARRMATLQAAADGRIPFTTGLLVGIGETRRERLTTLLAIKEQASLGGHVQEVIVQNFLPKAGTAMAGAPPCPPDELIWTVAVARLVLGGQAHIQAPPNLSTDLASLVDAGIDDWGGVSPLTPDHVNPERPWPALEALRLATEAAGKTLAPRLTVYPEYVADLKTWIAPELHAAVLRASDSEGLARDDSWSAGAIPPPPVLLPAAGDTRAAGGRVGEVLAGVALRQELEESEIVALLGARGPDFVAVCEVADDLRSRLVGDLVTYVRNRNINYTNVCTFKCRFCAFSKGPLSLSLRGSPYLLDQEEIARRVSEAWDAGATEVCLQGGIHPSFDGNYYLDVVKTVKTACPGIHVHGFTALEVHEGARRSGVGLAEYLTRLREAGLASLPGTAAEILDDEVRAIICPDKVTTDEWLEVHRVAHSVGLRSNVTIMFGHVERPIHVARHLMRARGLQRETGGFTEVVPLPFVHMASPIHLQGRARSGPTFREALLVHAVSRIVMAGVIDHIQVSWVKMGLEGARQALLAGCDDLGGTLMNESISRAAGASHGQGLEAEDFAAIVAPLGRPLAERTTFYSSGSLKARSLETRCST
ncbi:MAG: 5-amino-6-(D-ribitylamino)uracil--L-tyrosine 4-hydroxyphenyl transferase CofH, partial [Acidimicrobiia bacterium]